MIYAKNNKPYFIRIQMQTETNKYQNKIMNVSNSLIFIIIKSALISDYIYLTDRWANTGVTILLPVLWGFWEWRGFGIWMLEIS